MKHIRAIITLLVLIVSISSFGQSENTNTEYSPVAHHKIALEVLEASKKWISSFNNGNAESCVQGYAQEAVMSAMPYGIKKGVKEISEFWTPFIKSGATNLVYSNVSIEVADNATAFLSANWSMNVGRGIIFQEKWEKIEGQWLLTYDNFKVLEKFEAPRDNNANPIGSHIVLEEVIKESMKWIKGFNAGKKEVCGNGYTDNATMNAMPFASVQGKASIEDFWEKLIADGAKNLTYHNPIFTVKTDTSVLLSSNWSMNIGEGKIYLEKWDKLDNTWLLTYDEFQVIKQHK